MTAEMAFWNLIGNKLFQFYKNVFADPKNMN